MPRSKARVVNIFGKTVILKKNPWYSERLLNLLTSLGKKPKKPETVVATPPPWFMNPSAMPQAVYERAKMFSEVSSATARKPIEERLKIIREKLATGRKERGSRAKPRDQLFHVRFPNYDALRGVAPAPEARAPAQRARPEVRA
jgi:hypothetical protein